MSREALGALCATRRWAPAFLGRLDGRQHHAATCDRPRGLPLRAAFAEQHVAVDDGELLDVVASEPHRHLRQAPHRIATFLRDVSVVLIDSEAAALEDLYPFRLHRPFWDSQLREPRSQTPP